MPILSSNSNSSDTNNLIYKNYVISQQKSITLSPNMINTLFLFDINGSGGGILDSICISLSSINVGESYIVTINIDGIEHKLTFIHPTGGVKTNYWLFTGDITTGNGIMYLPYKQNINGKPATYYRDVHTISSDSTPSFFTQFIDSTGEITEWTIDYNMETDSGSNPKRTLIILQDFNTNQIKFNKHIDITVNNTSSSTLSVQSTYAIRYTDE